MMAPWQYHAAFDAHKRLIEAAQKGTANLQSRRIHGAAMQDDNFEVKPKSATKKHSGDMETEILQCCKPAPRPNCSYGKASDAAKPPPA